MSFTSTIEDRLATYRHTLDTAIAERSAPDIAHDGTVEIDITAAGTARRSGRAGLLVGATGLVLAGGLTAVIALQDHPSGPPAASITSARPTVTDSQASVTQDTDVPDATAPGTTVPGSGTTPRCPADTGTVPTGTLYLGAPGSAQNLAAAGFIFSLAHTTPKVDLAMKAIAMPVLGLECSIDAGPTSDPDVFTVAVGAPATPTPFDVTVALAERGDVAGAIAINGSTGFDTTSTELRLTSGLPDGAARVQIRFKKGDDVWELTAPPTAGVTVALEVPVGETDRFPDHPVDWVLFTVLDSNYRVLDAGGQVIVP